MSDVSLVEKRMMGWRLAVWLAALLLAYVGFAEPYPLAWRIAAFGARAGSSEGKEIAGLEAPSVAALASEDPAG
jgi:hypothetical protein